MDPSQELVILSGEVSNNKQIINTLKHQLRTATMEHKATKRAADGHLQELRSQLDETQRKVSLLQRAKGTPQVPKIHLEHSTQRLAMKKRELEAKRRECSALEGIIKAYAGDEKLMLLDLFDVNFDSDRMALEMVTDTRRGGGGGVSSYGGDASPSRTMPTASYDGSGSVGLGGGRGGGG